MSPMLFPQWFFQPVEERVLIGNFNPKVWRMSTISEVRRLFLSSFS